MSAPTAPPPVRTQPVAERTGRVAEAREPADLADPNSPLAVLSSQLSVYTGVVETARANNLQGNPVGAAYQGEASTLMRDKLLPAARSLYDTETQGVADDQDAATSWL